MQVDEAIQNRRGREGQCRVIVVELAQLVAISVAMIQGGIRIAFPVVPVLYEFIEVLDLVHTQGSIAFQRQPLQRCPHSRQFHTEAVRVLDIGGQRFADIAHGTRLHKLVLIIHIVAVHPQAPVLRSILITQFIIDEALGCRGGVVTVVGEVVALGLTMTHGHRTIDTMAVLLEAEACLWIEEVVFLIDVEIVLVVEIGLLVVDKLVVVAVGLVAYVAELHIGKHIPLRGDVVESLHEGTPVQFCGIGVVVFVVAVLHEQCAQLVVAQIGDVAEVVAVELLQGETSHDVPVLILVVQVPNQSVGILLKTFLAYPVGALHTCQRFAVELLTRQTEFLDFVLPTELFVVAVAVCVVQGGHRVPMVVDVPSGGEQVVALPEVVGGLVPRRSVAHHVALSEILAVGTAGKIVAVVAEHLVKSVVAAESCIIEVLIGLDACRSTIGAIHQREVIVASRHTVPRLSGLLKISKVLIGNGEMIVDVAK